MRIIAVDPGKSGGIAEYDSCTKEAKVYPMPDTEQDLVNLLGNLFATYGGDCACYLEQVGGYVGGGGQPGSAMFTFGWWASGPLWIAHCYRIRVIRIPPQKWQKILSLGTSGGDKTTWKNKLKTRAQELFPNLKVTLKTADALLILEAALTLEK